jgi:cell division protease FtsH
MSQHPRDISLNSPVLRRLIDGSLARHPVCGPACRAVATGKHGELAGRALTVSCVFDQIRQFVRRHRARILIFSALVALAGAWGVYQLTDREPRVPATPAYSTLVDRVHDGAVSKLRWNPNTGMVTVTETTPRRRTYSVAVPATNGAEGLQLLLREARESSRRVTVTSVALDSHRPSLLSRAVEFVPTVLIIALLLIVARGMIPGLGRRIEPVTSKVSFADVAGCEEAIEELGDVRSFLRDPSKYAALGANVPKGVLLYGPPGTGKTLLAKAVANEAGCPFYETSGSEFVEMFAGLGARRVRQLFAQAKANAPAIIFIDELDAVGSKRSSGGGDGATREGDQTLLQLLKEMDGFSEGAAGGVPSTWRRLLGGRPLPDVSHPVIVMGATNRRESLDSALLRPGRFDRHISIDPPDRNGRRSVLEVHAHNKPLADDVNLDDMSVHSAGFTGAELALWLNESAMIAARRGHDRITHADTEDAYFRIIAGPRKQHRAMSDDERERVAFHEAGHAIVGERLNTTERVHKVSIIPRGQSGGQTINVSAEDVFLHREQALRDQIAMLLAGRAAEELHFGERTSGAYDDLTRATTLAQKMVTELGMGDVLGLRVTNGNNVASEAVRAQVDEEIKHILAQEYDRAAGLLTDQRELLETIAHTLLEEEVIDRERFVELITGRNRRADHGDA